MKFPHRTGVCLLSLMKAANLASLRVAHMTTSRLAGAPPWRDSQMFVCETPQIERWRGVVGHFGGSSRKQGLAFQLRSSAAGRDGTTGLGQYECREWRCLFHEICDASDR
eukprot:GFKZ01015019.1.p1 GENE.GFKZ01015019.1~~GFKZ01015019.1.p1  ORF type:complete len:110 (+),score=2.26 GFKZ01015019.1:331-660(+)